MFFKILVSIRKGIDILMDNWILPKESGAGVVNPSVSTDSSTLEVYKFLVASYSSTIVVLYPETELSWTSWKM